MINPSYAAMLIVTGTLAILVAGLAWRGRNAAGVYALTVMSFALALWAGMYAWYWLTPNLFIKLIALDIAFIGVVVIAPAILTMSLEFAGYGDWLTRRYYVLLAIIPLLTLLMIWTDPLHNLFYGGRDVTDPSNLLRGGPWYWFFIFFSYLLLLISLIVTWHVYVNNHGLYRAQAGFKLAGMALPWMSNIFGLSGFVIFPGMDITPMVATISAAVFCFGYFRHHVVDLAPLGRDMLVENLDEAIVVLDTNNRIVDINPKALESIDPSPDLPLGRRIDEAFSRWAYLFERYTSYEGRVEHKLECPPYLYIELRILSLKDRQGRKVGKLVTWRDISARKEADEKIRIFQQAVVQNPAAIVITDAEGYIEYVNPRFTQLTGYAPDEARGRNPRFFQSGSTQRDAYALLWNTIKKGETWAGEIQNRKKNGELYWAYEMIAPVVGENGLITHFVAMQQDVTATRRHQEELYEVNACLQAKLVEVEILHGQLREEAIRDSLTRLYNRRYMEETLDREISRVARDPRPISVVMMDVDLFKSINDTFGHQAGDSVLQTLGTLLLENTRVSDIACRYGGDEMLVVMPGATHEIAVARAEEWRATFSLMEFIFGDEQFHTTLSLGVATFPNQAQNPIELLNAADKALYCAKQTRNQVVLYAPSTMKQGNYKSDDVR
ncbi:MAG: diguanylate cyclase [Chloroflexi bacterium]|nr:diguanylate cyclase [Chloroflexota bacterium]